MASLALGSGNTSDEEGDAAVVMSDEGVTGQRYGDELVAKGQAVPIMPRNKLKEKLGVP